MEEGSSEQSPEVSAELGTFAKPEPPLTCPRMLDKASDDDDNKLLLSADNDDSNKSDVAMAVEEERNYESEPVSLEKFESRKKLRKRTYRNQPGKTRISKEMRKLSRKHALLEKNLKIEGLPDPPPKFRKRRLSQSSSVGRPHEKDTPYKRRRLASVESRPKRDHMPKWELLGGDANDPLNLNGLAHSEEGRLLNLKTPESSPLPTPDFRKIVYVKVPPNIEDPLNLEGKHDQRVIDRMLSSTVKKRHRSKKKKQDDGRLKEMAAEAVAMEQSSVVIVADTTVVGLPVEMDSQQVTEGKSDNIGTKTPDVPSTPPKVTARARSRSVSASPERKFRRQLSGGKGKPGLTEPKKFPEKPKFALGNYNRYYGYRNEGHVQDPRLRYFDPSWFKGRDVLDIGCNVGHITLAVAEQLHPRKILGIDIDGKLIQAARQNIRHMLSLRRKDSSKYPRVFELTRGPLEAHPLIGSSDIFPNNILFLQGNYVPSSEEILNLQKEEFDTILALSITKWIHLNNGDDGLKLFFQKIFRQLRPGGRLILEPQPWSTYRKRAKLSSELFAKYQSIKLKPEGFKHYLLSIGFVKCEVIGVPVTKSKGFRRPLILFTKADNKHIPDFPVIENVDVRDVCQECGNTDKSLCDHPQFTGMRRGPYASHMYDHINYPYTSSDSPYMSSSRTYSAYSYTFNVPSNEDNSFGVTEGNSSSTVGTGGSSSSGDFHEGWGNGQATGTSTSGSRSDRGSHSDSYESQTSSGSSQSYSSTNTSGSDSTRSSSMSYFSPDLNGPNGDIAHEYISLEFHGPNGDISHEFNSPVQNGPNGDVLVEIDFPDTDSSGVHSSGNSVQNISQDLHSLDQPGPQEEQVSAQVSGSSGSAFLHGSSAVVEAGVGGGDVGVVEASVGGGDVGAVEASIGNDNLAENVHGSNSVNSDQAVEVAQHRDGENQT